jgi:hypothetical protein
VQDWEVWVYVFEEGAYQHFEVWSVARVQVSALDGDRAVGGTRWCGGIRRIALVVAACRRGCLGSVLAKARCWRGESVCASGKDDAGPVLTEQTRAERLFRPAYAA